ncbi:polysaccharide deacetylase family protein [Virgifigura deserti]|uniref:polysaccharide deacetylase family protein n=1 Tax=Virgifigura deserti TaxID=2268457 RepID=UPI003CCC3A02
MNRASAAETDWTDLDRELAAWAAAGRTATFWWRDDDAVGPSAALDRLLGLAAAEAVPLALAVIPAETGPALADTLREHPGRAVLQHGYTHWNHAPAGEKKAELGAHRTAAEVTATLSQGQDRLRVLFGAQFLPVLVPPWNRIDPALIPALPGLGFTGLSTYGGKAGATPGGLAVIDTHIDIIDWRNGRGFVGEAAALALAVRHLAARRRGETAPDAPIRDEPTGLLTHHLVHDQASWAFIAAFIARVAAHPAARWLDVFELFDPDRTAWAHTA